MKDTGAKVVKRLSRFHTKSILVYGDMMLDKYIWGDVFRISPEAPVQVVHVSKETFAPGGAANVATNLAALGARVRMVGLAGKDEAGNTLKRDLEQLGIDAAGMIQSKTVSTIQKVRIVGKGQQLLRVDYETNEPITPALESAILSRLETTLDSVDAVVISDYAKGRVTRKICARLIQWGIDTGKPVVVDPKPKHLEFYKNATVLTPNSAETRKMAGLEDDQRFDVQTVGAGLARSLNANMLVTLGEKGMCLCERNGKVTQIPAHTREVYSLVGAGDTVVASLTLALASGSDLREAAAIANIAAGIKVGKAGTATVTLAELKKGLTTEARSHGAKK